MDLSLLNPPQREAVLHETGPLVVFAGAGSGKTRVITYRIAHLVGEGGVAPWRIMAVTFTNKAAGELRARLAQMVPGAERLWVGTFHALCARLLRKYAEYADVSPQFVIYDDTDQKAMVTRILRDLDLDERRFAPRELMGRIGKAKRELSGPREVDTSDFYGEIFAKVYQTYEQRMRQCGALDFSDLIYRMVLALRNEPALQKELSRKWEHLLVDEFQDTNHVQLELVRLLAEGHGNLCVVGDDDQSIYRWRGAERRHILQFRESFAGARVVKLEQNYRSTGHILAAATSVIALNREREPKTLFTDNPLGEKIRVLTCSDERDEARAISEAIRTVSAEEGTSYADIAVFYRTHAQSRVFEEELRACNIPYRVVGGQRFYERAEVKDVLAYLRVLLNVHDDVSLLRILNTPARGIGKTTREKLLHRAAERGQSLWDALSAAVDDGSFTKGTTSKLRAFHALITAACARAREGQGPATLAQTVLDDTGYLQALRDQDSVEADGRLENLQELLGSLSEFENEADEPTLAAYLELVTLQSNVDEMDAEAKVTLMTVHAAKGLEFPVVWVAGLEDRLFPLQREGYLGDDDLEEERRLAYVAFTRAERRLFLSHAGVRRLRGQLQVGLPSMFLDEIPPEHVERIERARYGMGHGGGGAFSQQRARRQRFAARGGAASATRAAPHPATRPLPAGESYVDRSEGDLEPLAEGARVRHAKFGIGEVCGVSPGVPPKVTVSFPGWGTKQIVARFLEPA